MPDQRGYARIVIPAEMLESKVKPMQRRIFAETGEVLGTGMVVRRMIEMAFAQGISEHSSNLSSGQQ